MKISQLAAALGLEVVTSNYEDLEVKTGYTSDLLSDVMGFAEEESVLITIQAHKNTIAVATQLDLAGVIICNNRAVSEDMQSAAEESGIAILKTSDNQFMTSSKVFNALFPNE